MSITPTGGPVWEGSSGHADYGGHANKRNHLSLGVIDPETDVSGEQLARMAADLAAVARVAPFAVLDITCNDSSPAAPTINTCYLNTGVRATSYEGDAAPAGFPTASRVASGRFTLHFSTSYSDDYGVSANFAIGGRTGSHADETGGTVTVIKDSDTVATVRAFNASGSADSDARVSVVIWAAGGS